jgi:hypothetical protein
MEFFNQGNSVMTETTTMVMVVAHCAHWSPIASVQGRLARAVVTVFSI